MTFVQHIPAFFEGADPFRVEFQTLEELLANSWIDGWSKDPDFHRFSLSDERLMSESNKGRHWWVLGVIRDGDPKSLNLPAWVPATSRDV